MSKSNTFENDLLKLIFNATPIAGLADNASASPVTTLYLALHTADPGEDGTQTTNEVAYTGYARIAVARSSAGWTVTDSSVRPVAVIEYGEMTAGTPSTATHVTIGTASAGVGKVLYRGTLTPNVSIAVGVVPRIRTSSTITED